MYNQNINPEMLQKRNNQAQKTSEQRELRLTWNHNLKCQK